MTPDGCPETLIEAIAHFANPQVAHEFMVGMRWQGGVECPMCAKAGERVTNVSYYSNRRVFRCGVCKRQFTLKTSTIFEDSPLGLDKWLPCVWMIVNAKNGVSSCEIARSLGVTQKTAWFMLHRVRAALKVSSFEKMKGIVEADETAIGGLAKNMHKAKRAEKIKGTGFKGKSIVMGLLEHGERKRVRAKVVKDVQTPTLKRVIDANVEKGATLHTDAYRSYKALGPDYVHRFVDHAVEYVKDNVHTNGLENFWCLLKRTIKGTYTYVDGAQLQAYLDEQAWRYNERKANDGERFSAVTKSLCGKRLTYKQLTSRILDQAA